MLHCPLEHTALALGFAMQGMPQAPQFWGSVAVSTQAPPHSIRGSTHAKSQLPAAQTGVAWLGAMHTVSHAPQWAVLLNKSTHEPSQLVVPPEQVRPHVPPAHTSSKPHALGQLPQWALFDFKSTHSPLQSV